MVPIGTDQATNNLVMGKAKEHEQNRVTQCSRNVTLVVRARFPDLLNTMKTL